MPVAWTPGSSMYCSGCRKRAGRDMRRTMATRATEGTMLVTRSCEEEAMEAPPHPCVEVVESQEGQHAEKCRQTGSGEVPQDGAPPPGGRCLRVARTPRPGRRGSCRPAGAGGVLRGGVRPPLPLRAVRDADPPGRNPACELDRVQR